MLTGLLLAAKRLLAFDEAIDLKRSGDLPTWLGADVERMIRFVLWQVFDVFFFFVLCVIAGVWSFCVRFLCGLLE